VLLTYSCPKNGNVLRTAFYFCMYLLYISELNRPKEFVIKKTPEKSEKKTKQCDAKNENKNWNKKEEDYPSSRVTLESIFLMC